MKTLYLLLLLAVTQTSGQTSQKIWKQFICDNKTYRVLRVDYKDAVKGDSIFIQQKNGNKWSTDASWYMPSEGAKYKDVNEDGFMDISLQMRFGQIVFIYSSLQKKYVQMGEVSYDGFEKAGNQPNIWYTFIQYKKTHEWWAQLFTIKDGKKVLLHELVATPYRSEDNDDLFDTKYESIVYNVYVNGKPLAKQVFKQEAADAFLKEADDEVAACKKWLLNKYEQAAKK